MVQVGQSGAVISELVEATDPKFGPQTLGPSQPGCTAVAAVHPALRCARTWCRLSSYRVRLRFTVPVALEHA
jgi:hypothetical protein